MQSPLLVMLLASVWNFITPFHTTGFVVFPSDGQKLEVVWCFQGLKKGALVQKGVNELKLDFADPLNSFL